LIFRALFPRSSIFRTPRFFALVHLHFLIFTLITSCSCVCIRPGQDSQDRTPRTGQAEQNRQNRTGRTEQAEQDSQNRTARTGQQERDRQNKTTLTGEPGQDSQDMKART
jgi:hypothetical protein